MNFFKKIFILILFLTLTLFFSYKTINNQKVNGSNSINEGVITCNSAYTITQTSVGTKYQVNNEIVSIDIKIDNNPGISGAIIQIDFDSCLTLAEVKLGNAFASLDYTAPGNYNSPCRLSWDSLDAESIVNGTIATLLFQVSENTPNGKVAKINLSYNEGDIYNVDLLDVNPSISGGAINIIDFIPGDVNDDGVINGKDVTLLRRYNSSGYNVTINEYAADVNNDGLLNGKDITLIRRFFAGGYDVILQPHIEKCTHQLEHKKRIEPTCETDGNIEYYQCLICEKYFSDSSAANEILLQDTIIVKKGHSFSTSYSSDSVGHWFASTCEHSSLKKDYAEHDYGADSHCCSICGYENIQLITLNSPEITDVKYDIIHWTEVANAGSYTVIVNKDYYFTTNGTQCDLKDVKRSIDGHCIANIGPVSIEVVANAKENSKYINSQPSEVHNSYIYVPEYTNLVNFNDFPSLTDGLNMITYNNNGIGRGYNIIEDEYLKANAIKEKNIFNLDKLFTLGTPTNASVSESEFYSFSYSTIDEYFSRIEADATVGGSLGLKPYGALKFQLTEKSINSYSSYKYNNTYVYTTKRNNGDLKFTNLIDSKYLYNCLSFEFLKDITRESELTHNMSDEELSEYIYSNYGTHAILGVTMGGIHYSVLTISTNNYSTAAKVDELFKINAKSKISDLLSLGMNVEGKLEQDKQWNNSETRTYFRTYYYGGSGGVLTAMDPSDAQGTINTWDQAVAANPVVRSFCNNGGLAMQKIIQVIDPMLAKSFENYLMVKSENNYEELVNTYQIWNTDVITRDKILIPVNVEEENGLNVLKVNLSKLQSIGSFENVYSPYLVDNKFAIYPTMMGKTIDKVVIDGSINTLNSFEVINDFQLVFDGNFTKNIEVEIKNAVIINQNNYFVDTTNVTSARVASFIRNNIKYHNSLIGEKSYYNYYVDNKHFISEASDDINIKTFNNCLPICEKELYDFTGWFINNVQITDEFGSYLDSYQTANDSSIIEPHYTPKKFLVVLDANGGVVGTKNFFVRYKDQSYDENDNVIYSIMIPSKTGYDFKGYYYIIDDETEKQYVNESGIIASSITIDIKGELTLIAKWESKELTITLDSNDSNLYVKYKDNVYKKENNELVEVTEITPPTKESYFFGGYYVEINGIETEIITSNGTIVGKDYLINLTENTTLYAKWLKVSVVQLDINGGSGGFNSNMYINSNGVYSNVECTSSITRIVTPTKEGYTFVGYFDGENKLINENGEISPGLTEYNSNVMLVAKYTANTYTVSFDANGGNLSTNSLNFVYDTEYANLPTPTKANHKFLGWFIDDLNEIRNGDVVKITENKTATAKWKRTQYEIIFETNGGNHINSVFANCNEEFSLEPYIPVKVEHVFLGWYSDIELKNKITSCNYSTESSITVYAKWEEKKYTLTIDLQGLSGVEQFTLIVKDSKENIKIYKTLVLEAYEVFNGEIDYSTLQPIYETVYKNQYSFQVCYGYVVQISSYKTNVEYKSDPFVQKIAMWYEYPGETKVITGDTHLNVSLTYHEEIVLNNTIPFVLKKEQEFLF